jgi:hypothetical protein
LKRWTAPPSSSRTRATPLPAPLPTKTMLRKTVYGVADAATLGAIAEELGKRPRSAPPADGSIEAKDDMGFALGFQVTVRRAISIAAETINARRRQRAPNVVAVSEDAAIVPRTCRTWSTSCRTRQGRGLLRRTPGLPLHRPAHRRRPLPAPAGTLDHHTLFMIQTPPFMKGCEHFTFHLGGPTELMQAGTASSTRATSRSGGRGATSSAQLVLVLQQPAGLPRRIRRRHGPARRQWTARTAPMSADASQLFLFQSREKWAPAAAATGRTEVGTRHAGFHLSVPHGRTARRRFARLRSREQRPG